MNHKIDHIKRDKKHAPNWFMKKRGFYFHRLAKIHAAHFKISPAMVTQIRDYAVGRRMKRQEICFYITRILNMRKVDKKSISSRFQPELKEKILKFLLHCTPYEFDTITQLTKYDWDFYPEGIIPRIPPKVLYGDKKNI